MLKFKAIIFAWFFFGIINMSEEANILGMFHIPVKSHHVLGSALLKALAGKGHNVTMISPYPLKEKLENYTDVPLKGLMEFKAEYLDPSFVNQTWSHRIKKMYNMLPSFARTVLNQESMVNLLSNRHNKFDVIILCFPMSDGFFGLGHHFDAPIVLFSPVGTTMLHNDIAGNINPYSYVPLLKTTFTDKMTFMQRVLNTLLSLVVEVFNNAIIYPQQVAISKEHFPNAPPMEDLRENVALTLVNSHFTTETPRPYTPNLIQIGGFHMEESKPLPEELKTYLDKFQNGVVYFSLGSNIKTSTLPMDKINTILICLSKLKENVLWQVDDVNFLQNKPSNIITAQWLPQRSVLSHPNVKLFITHGGLGSVTEATYSGVPMLAMPFFGDQAQNVAEAMDKQYAIQLKFDDITEDTFTAALNEVLNNSMYQKNVKRLSSLLSDQLVRPMDKAIYWIEHVIKHKGAAHLKPASLRLNVIQHLLIDVTLFLVASAFTVCLFFYFFVKVICNMCKKKNSEKLKSS